MTNSMVPLTEALKNDFEAQQHYDITFLVGGEDIHALKYFLSLRSPVFKAMIESPTAYVDGKILISDPNVTSADFKELLKFMYTDECEITRENLEALLHLGNMYDVPLLMEKCAEFVESVLLKANNFREYSEIGLLYADQCSLLSKCLDNISKCYFKEDPQIPFSLLDVSEGLILKMAKDSKRCGEFTEEKLFDAVLDWAKNECLKNPETANLNEVLKEILPFIKFEDLKPLTLATTVAENNFLCEKEMLDALRKSVINAPKKECAACVDCGRKRSRRYPPGGFGNQVNDNQVAGNHQVVYQPPVNPPPPNYAGRRRYMNPQVINVNLPHPYAQQQLNPPPLPYPPPPPFNMQNQNNNQNP